MNPSLRVVTLVSLFPVLTAAGLWMASGRVATGGELNGEFGASPAAFEALHFTFGKHSHSRTVALGSFTVGGPQAASLRPVGKDLRQLVGDDRGRHYALTQHEVGRWNANSGKFEKMVPEGVERISWPAGLAFSTRDRRLWISSATGAGGFLHSFDVQRGAWRRFELGQTRLAALAYDRERDRLFGLVDNLGKSVVSEFAELNAHGAVLRRVELAEPVFVNRGPFLSVQLRALDDVGHLLVSDPKPHPRLSQHRLYRVDLRNGAIELLPYGKDPQRLEDLWPGMPDGATTFDDSLESCMSGAPSNYVTPLKFLRGQGAELHVVSVRRGNVNGLQEILRRVKKVEIDGSGKIALSLDLSTKTAPVDVRVLASRKPLVICVVACDAVTWRFQLEDGASVTKVLILGHGEQSVLGLPAEVTIDDRGEGDLFTSRFACASAWEVEHNTGQEFDRLIRRVRKLSGLREASFQGCGYGRRFEVPLK